MPIEFACDECDKQYRVRDDLAGRKIRCKECGTGLQIPSDEEPLFDEIDEDELISDAMPARRKPKKKKRKPSQQSGIQTNVTFVNKLQLTALVLIAVMVFQAFGSLYFAAALFAGAFGGIGHAFIAIGAIASFLAKVALLIGGIGILQKEAYGAPLAEKGAWALIVIALISIPGAMLTMSKFESATLAPYITRSIISAILSMALPGALIYCIRHPDWDVPD